MPITIKRGDTSPAVRYSLPSTVDLTGATVRFSLAAIEGAPLIYRAPAIIAGPSVVEYQWQDGDTRLAGVFDGEFELTFADGRIETFPNSGFIAVTIEADAGWRLLPPAETVTHLTGDTTNAPIVITDDHGQPLDLTGATVTVSVRVGAAWIAQTATAHDPLIGEAWPDWGALDLPPRVYLARVTAAWADETQTQQFVLKVTE